MKHRGIEFDVEEVSPSQWRWKIHESEMLGSALVSEPEYSHRASAIINCVNKINCTLGAANDR